MVEIKSVGREELRVGEEYSLDSSRKVHLLHHMPQDETLPAFVIDSQVLSLIEGQTVIYAGKAKELDTRTSSNLQHIHLFKPGKEIIEENIEIVPTDYLALDTVSLYSPDSSVSV